MNMHRCRIAMAIVLFLLAACSPTPPAQVGTPPPALGAMATSTPPLVPTDTPSPTFPASPLPSATPTQSAMAIATPAQPPTRTATPSPTPTESASQRYKPAFGIDYGQPDKYLEQGEQTALADRTVMGVLLQRKPGWAQVAEIFGWLRHEFKSSAGGGVAIGVSTTEQLLKTRVMTGCHDWALVYASFARALGYPTVVVDAASIPWMKQAQSGKKGAYSGHVFVEVYVAGKWILIDSTNGWYVEKDYDPASPVLPIKAGFPGETDDLYGFYVMRKGIDTRGYGIHSNAELTRLMDETARQVPVESLVNPKYSVGRLR